MCAETIKIYLFYVLYLYLIIAPRTLITTRTVDDDIHNHGNLKNYDNDNHAHDNNKHENRDNNENANHDHDNYDHDKKSLTTMTMKTTTMTKTP